MKCTACKRVVDSATSISCPIIECGRVFCTDKCASTCIVTCGKSGCETRRCRPCATGKTWSLLHRRKVEVILGCSLRDFYRMDKKERAALQSELRAANDTARSSMTDDHRPFHFCKKADGCNQSYCWECSLHQCHDDRIGRTTWACPSCQTMQCSHCAVEFCLECDPHFNFRSQTCSGCLEDNEPQPPTPLLEGSIMVRRLTARQLSKQRPAFMHRLFRIGKCGHCLRLVKWIATEDGVITTKQCGGCKAVYYCDEMCQAHNWPLHREKCASLKEHTARVMEREEANNLEARKHANVC